MTFERLWFIIRQGHFLRFLWDRVIFPCCIRDFISQNVMLLAVTTLQDMHFNQDGILFIAESAYDKLGGQIKAPSTFKSEVAHWIMKVAVKIYKIRNYSRDGILTEIRSILCKEQS